MKEGVTINHYGESHFYDGATQYGDVNITNPTYNKYYSSEEKENEVKGEEREIDRKQTSTFHDFIQNVEEEKLMAELHKRITPQTPPSTIGKILAYCHEEKHWLIRTPKKDEFEMEFPNCGNWNTIRSYFTERCKERISGIVIEL